MAKQMRFRSGKVVRFWRPGHGPTRFSFRRTSSGFVLSLRWVLIRWIGNAPWDHPKADPAGDVAGTMRDIREGRL